MIIPCFRCNKKIDTPDASNADYIMAQDTIVREPREVLAALKHNQATLAKVDEIKLEETTKGNPSPTEDLIRSKFRDNEYDAMEVPDVATAQRQFGEDLVKVIAKVEEKDIQKTGIICPDCYKDTDFVIWGIHKGQGVEKLEKK